MASVVEEDEMKKGWTEKDEKEFQKLLHQRQAAAKAVLKEMKVTDDQIDMFACNLQEDSEASDHWDNFIDHSSPDEVRDTFEYLNDME